jgi:hypothetical protein
MWFVSLISVILLYFAYAYLKNLHNCNCVNSTYTTRLKYMEEILLGLNIIVFCFSLLSSFHILGALERFKTHIFKLLMLGGISMILFYIYFVYNAYEFWNTMHAKCTCADGWQKYYIYLQSFAFLFIILFTTVLTGFVAFKKVPLGLITNNVFSKLTPPETKRVTKRSKRST